MSDQQISSESKAKRFIGSFGILAAFGFLALIFVQGVQTESLEERAYKGEFDAGTIEQRWANFEEVSSAQNKLVNEKKLAGALKSVVKSSSSGSKSQIVVPGSPTFLKQMEAATAPATEVKNVEGEKTAPATETEKKVAPAKAGKAKKADAKPKGEAKKAQPKKKAAAADNK